MQICFGKHEIKANNYLSEKECHNIEMHEIKKEMQRQEVKRDFMEKAWC